MPHFPLIQTAHLFPALHHKLIGLLQGLSPDDWHRPTVCAGWSVKDVAAHLLDTAQRTVAWHRDGYVSPEKPVGQSYPELVHFLNKINNDWVVATRRVSPAVLLDWLDRLGQEADALIMALPPGEPALFPVAWAGQRESPNWFHVAREYTERWHHQQQIRLAVGQTAVLETTELYQPVLDTFMRALPHAYRDVPAPVGTLLQFSVNDLAGGNWFLGREKAHWALLSNEQRTRTEVPQPTTLVRISRPFAWQLFTRNMPPDLVAAHVQIDGNAELGRPVLAMRSVMM